MLLYNQIVFSQNTSIVQTYKQLYNNIAVNLSSNIPEQPEVHSNLSLQEAPSDWKKIKSLLLSSDVLVKQNKQAEGIEFALEALERAKRSGNYNYQSIIYGFLSIQCRTIGFYNKGKYYLNQGLISSSKILDKSKELQYLAMADHEFAEYALLNRNYEKALQYIEKAETYYKSLEEGPYRSFVIASAQLLMGHCKIGLEEYNQALIHFRIASDNLKSSHAENSIYTALVHQGKGESYLRLQKSDSAQVYLVKALKHTEEFDNAFINEKVYGSLATYYRGQNKVDSAMVYLTKYNQAVVLTRDRNQQQIDKVFKFLGESHSQEVGIDWKPVYGVGFILITVGLGFYVYWNKPDHSKVTKVVDIESQASKTTNSRLSPQMVEKLSQKIKIFEYQKGYLDKELSISKLATETGTNTKYLKYYLKYNLHTDYPTYINKLRIQFITDELITNPQTRKYTLAYLADLSGYGSYSAFAVNFKRIMNQAPSTYIQHLNGNRYYKNSNPGIAS